jgi:hypothetical protein
MDQDSERDFFYAFFIGDFIITSESANNAFLYGRDSESAAHGLE